jgi:molybdenum cofactor cytidylyltransferase
MGLIGIILAAGESARMGRDKALLPWPPSALSTSSVNSRSASTETLLSASIQVLEQHCEMVIVVAGRNEAAVSPIVYGCGAFLVRNPAPERGQFSSLQTGLREVLNRGRDAAMITLVDRPPASTKTFEVLVNAFEGRAHGIWAVVPEFHGKHGHPIVAGREMLEIFLKALATDNARDIEHANQSQIAYVPVEDSRVTANINTQEDYANLAEERA